VKPVTIERIAAGGDGVGRLPDGMTVFVPRTAPDDVVAIEVLERKPRYARARLRRVESGSPHRIEPSCPHYVSDSCGSCQLQHLAPEAQLEVKRGIVGDALRRIAKRDVGVSGDGTQIGYHRSDRPAAVFELQECLLADPRLNQLWHSLRQHRSLFPRGLRNIVLRADREGGLHVVLLGGAAPFQGTRLASAVGREDISYWWAPEQRAPRVVAGLRGGFPALAFAQSHPEFAARIRADAVGGLGEVRGRVVWDLYGGVGDGARLLATRGANVWSVDRDRSAIEWAEGSPHTEDDQVDPRYLSGLVEEVLHRLPTPGAILLNPPRGGAHRRVAAAIQDWGRANPGSRVSYISCDPATLARDIGRLPDFRLVSVTGYDLFPQTAHVETLTVLEAAP